MDEKFFERICNADRFYDQTGDGEYNDWKDMKEAWESAEARLEVARKALAQMKFFGRGGSLNGETPLACVHMLACETLAAISPPSRAGRG